MKTIDGKIVIGVDHGNFQIKTASDCFVSGFASTGKESIFQGLLEYDGVTYTLSEKRVPVRINKTENNDFKILSAFALGKELRTNNRTSGSYDVIMAAGLPPGHLSIPGLKEQWKNYLVGPYRFQYDNTLFHVNVKRVFVCPQGYAALFARRGDGYRLIDLVTKEQLALLIDIGGGTVDVIGLRFGVPIPEYHYSLPVGIVDVLNNINIAVQAKSGNSLPESTILNVLNGIPNRVPADLVSLIHSEMRSYTNKLLLELTELHLPIDSSLSVLMGGGANAVFAHWVETGKFSGLELASDICATVKGFEEMAGDVLIRETGR